MDQGIASALVPCGVETTSPMYIHYATPATFYSKAKNSLAQNSMLVNVLDVSLCADFPAMATMLPSKCVILETLIVVHENRAFPCVPGANYREWLEWIGKVSDIIHIGPAAAYPQSLVESLQILDRRDLMITVAPCAEFNAPGLKNIAPYIKTLDLMKPVKPNGSLLDNLLEFITVAAELQVICVWAQGIIHFDKTTMAPWNPVFYDEYTRWLLFIDPETRSHPQEFGAALARSISFRKNEGRRID